ncbi:MAG: DUF6398 domain-containing protein [Candidatus Cloacimonetes bacterium]|nr:DUF6398 domain-containing protein [Candidatus Cloacimonadota bacterium]
MQHIFDSIVILTEEFCKENLNEEYSLLIRQATATLCRKRPSPLLRGKMNTWACGIIYALGSVNFLFDPSQTPYISASKICEIFGVSKSSGGNYSKKVRDALKTYQFDVKWGLPSKLGNNPFVWQIIFNGYVVDVRSLSREIQEIAYRKGLIPYIPADKKD